MKTILVLTVSFGVAVLAATQGPPKCSVCSQAPAGEMFLLSSPGSARPQPVCKACTQLDTICSSCRMPVKDNYAKLDDGRVLCPADAKVAVTDLAQARRIFEESKSELFRLFAGTGVLPHRNVVLEFTDARALERTVKPQETLTTRLIPQGVTRSRRDEQQGIQHRVFVLHSLSPARLLTVCAHEYAHCWLNENAHAERSIEEATMEAFCDLAALKVMGMRHQAQEQKVVVAGSSNARQLETLIKADERYQFLRLCEWMKRGEDPKLDPADLARVLVLRDLPPPTLSWQPNQRTPVPDRLVLKGISGSGSRRFALINDSTLAPQETVKVRVGSSTVKVRCLHIAENSVTVQVDDSPQQIELRMRGE